MNISKIQPDALNYQVTIDIAAADYAESLKKRLNEYRRKADLKGFRKGCCRDRHFYFGPLRLVIGRERIVRRPKRIIVHI